MVALAAAEPVTEAPVDHIERRRREAVAVCGLYFAVAQAKRRELHPRCPGCLVRELERRDLVAEFTLHVLHARRRQAAVACATTRRMLAAKRQTELPI